MNHESTLFSMESIVHEMYTLDGQWAMLTLWYDVFLSFYSGTKFFLYFLFLSPLYLIIVLFKHKPHVHLTSFFFLFIFSLSVIYFIFSLFQLLAFKNTRNNKKINQINVRILVITFFFRFFLLLIRLCCTNNNFKFRI